jgi:uncharacterized protein involved in exopolysaccharide biosynthesis
VDGSRDRTELELRDYLRVLRRRKSTIAAAILVVLGFALTASLLQSPLYEGRAELLLQQRSTESLFNPDTGQPNDPARALQTEIRVLKSGPVKAAVKAKLGEAPAVAATPVGQTNDISVSVRSGSPKKAADIANAYANSYIEFRRKQAIDDLLAASQEVQSKVGDFQRQIDAIDAQIASTGDRQRSIVVQNLAPQRAALVDQQAVFRQKLNQLQVDAALKSGGAQLVMPASVPSSPVSPRPIRTGAIALVVGGVLGIALAFLLDYLDDTMKTKDDLDRVVHELPVLGLIPAVSTWKDKTRPQLVSLSDPTSTASEAYRTLRTSIQFLGLDRPLRTLQVTSPSAS